jgi:hypothetical protein
MVVGDDAHDAAALTHWSFGQLCSLASPSNSPASYFRDTNMPAPVIADCLDYNLRFTGGVEDVGILLTEDGQVNELRAVNLTHRAAPSGAGIPRIYGNGGISDTAKKLVVRVRRSQTPRRFRSLGDPAVRG